MLTKEYMNRTQMSKYLDNISKYMRTCKCGHRVMVAYPHKYIVCKWCGNKVYKDEREKFKDILGKRLKK